MRIILSVDYISRLNTGIANMVKIMTSSYINLNHEVYIAAIDDRFTDLDKKNYPTKRLLIIKNKNDKIINYKDYPEIVEWDIIISKKYSKYIDM